jgi:hypothetical protein
MLRRSSSHKRQQRFALGNVTPVMLTFMIALCDHYLPTLKTLFRVGPSEKNFIIDAEMKL